MTIDTATGYAIFDQKDYLNFKLHTYKLKTEGPEDITVAIQFCGVCGSDHHTINGEWGPFGTKCGYVVTGHEVVGTVAQVGPNVKDFKVGDRVGVGAQLGSCGECKPCKADNEQYCLGHITHGYNCLWDNGEDCQGGYANYHRAHQRFVFKLPENLASEDAASMMCAGITAFSPLKRAGLGPGKKVGIIGIGGIGHYAILFAKAMGAEVYAFSHSASKKDDCVKMGVKPENFIITTEGFEKDLKGELDFMVSSSSSSKLPLNELMGCLVVGGKLCFVGMPGDGLPKLTSQTMSANGCYIGSSHIGSGVEQKEMLQLAADKGIKPFIHVRPMSEANEAIKAVEDGSVRYRTILKMDIPAQ